MKTSARLLTSTLLLSAVPLMANANTSGDGTINTILTLWPYLTALIVIMFAFLWYQQIRLWMRRKKGETRRHTARGNQLTMLGIVTVFAILMIAAPRLLKRFDYSMQQTQQTMDPENRTEITFEVQGMTCAGCENAVQNRVAGIPGVESVKADHTTHQTTVVYDNSQTSREAIAESIKNTGYQVVDP